MNGTIRFVASSLLLSLSMEAVAWGADYIRYTPQPSDGKPSSGPREGVLVKQITIEKGDTLYGLSRKYSGKGSYFPQILLFNEIKNPDLIYAGNRLLVPLPPGQGEGTVATLQGSEASPKARVRRQGPSGETPKAQRESRDVGGVQRSTPTPPSSVSSPPGRVSAKPQQLPQQQASGSPRPGEENEQTLFERGVSAYKSGQYQQSLEAFDRFLARYPSSSLVPDATLYRADALLRLSGQ